MRKYYDIVIQSGRSQELKSKLPEIEKFLKEAGLDFKIFFTSQGNPEEVETISIMLNDNYDAEEMLELRRLCKERSWKKAVSITNTSRNPFQAYLKADELLKQLKQKEHPTSEELSLMLELGNYRAAIRNGVFNIGLSQYKNLAENLAEANLEVLKMYDKGEARLASGEVEYFQIIAIEGESYIPASRKFRKIWKEEK